MWEEKIYNEKRKSFRGYALERKKYSGLIKEDYLELFVGPFWHISSFRL